MDLIDDEEFDRLRFKTEDVKERFNFCDDCEVPMIITTSGYVCGECGRVEEQCGQLADCAENSVGVLRKNNGTNHGYYNISSNSSSLQKKIVVDLLYAKNNAFTGLKFPKNVLDECASEFNNMQKIIIECENGNSEKKYVRRGDIRGEILGTILYYKCINAGIPRKKKDIATFMSVSGISRGEDIIRTLCNDGKIAFDINTDSWEAYVNRYTESLGIDKLPKYDNYKNFVLNIVAESFVKRIGVTSIITSRIVGSLWILICHEKLPITSKQLEDSSDNIKKNTWTRFSKEIEINILKFVDIFNKWEIPHNIKGRLIRRELADKLIADKLITPDMISDSPSGSP